MAEQPPAHIREAIERDPHRAGSVDRVLLESVRWLTPSTREALYRPPHMPVEAAPASPPWLRQIVADASAGTVHEVQRATALRRWVAAIPRTFPEGGRSTHDGFWGDYRTFLCGGAEEEVIRKGSPLAAELCRVLVRLAQLAGLSARIVFLFADLPPLRHTVAEIFVAGQWAVFDPISDRSFLWPKHGHASAWDVRQMPALVDGLQDHARLRYVDSRFYRTIGIADYRPSSTDYGYQEDPLDNETAARLLHGEAS